MQVRRFFVLTCVAMAMVGCFDNKNNDVEQSMCTRAWYERVESRVTTGDGQGHGPDLGSAEWRSVVEFKLGIRGNTEVPAADTDAWCDYIDEQFIQTQG